MHKPKRFLWLIIILGAIVAVWIFVVATRHRPYQAIYPITAKPHVGEQATITISILKPKIKSEGDYTDRFEREKLKYVRQGFVVRCIKSQNSKRTLAVYHLEKTGQKSLAYKVYLDYSEESLKKRSVVRDAQGQIVPPGRSVRGWPVPFHYWLTWDGMIGKDVYRQDEDLVSGYHAITIWREQSCKLNVFRGDAQMPFFQVIQFWHPGDWIWRNYDYNTDNHDDYHAACNEPKVSE